MELTVFIILCVLGLITILLENKVLLNYLYIPTLLVFLVIVRLNAFVFNGFEIDILTYAKEMHATSFDVYYLREFIFWFSLRIIYFVTQSEIYSFIILDLFWIYILLKTISMADSQKFGKGMIVVLVTCFPFLFGYENIYRQFYATVVLLYAYSIINIRPIKSILIFIISIFIHNLSLFIIPLFVIRKCYKFNLRDRVFLSTLFAFIYVLCLPLLMSLKDADPTKVDLSYLYLFLFLILFMFFIYKFKENVYYFVKNIPSLLPISIFIFGTVLHKQEMITERLGMMFIPFLLYDLYLFSSKITNSLKRRLFRLILLIVFTLPVFLFSSSMIFLI